MPGGRKFLLNLFQTVIDRSFVDRLAQSNGKVLLLRCLFAMLWRSMIYSMMMTASWPNALLLCVTEYYSI